MSEQKVKCARRKCGWVGLPSELRQVSIKPNVTESHCPICDGNEFFCRLKPGETEKSKSGVQLIVLERERQTKVKGWSAEHDDQHTGAELSTNAALLILNLPGGWDLADKSFKKGGRIRQLVVAAALLAAEIDRIQRL